MCQLLLANEKSLLAAIEKASNGTLLIQQIYELPTDCRQNLNKFLSKDYLVSKNIRLITTSSSNINTLIRETGITQVSLKVTSLREHTEDIPELVNACTDYWSQHRSLPYRRFSIAAQNRLLHYNWPGNLSELNDLVCYLLESDKTGDISLEEVDALFQQKNVESDDWSDTWLEQAIDKPMREAREIFEKFYLTQQLKLVEGNVSQLATKVGMERTHLYRKMRSLGISLKDDNKRS